MNTEEMLEQIVDISTWSARERFCWSGYTANKILELQHAKNTCRLCKRYRRAFFELLGRLDILGVQYAISGGSDHSIPHIGDLTNRLPVNLGEEKPATCVDDIAAKL